MLKIRADEMIKNLDGNVIEMEGKKLSFVRGYALVLVGGQQSKDPLRAMLLSRKLIDKEGQDVEIELDVAEVKFLEEATKMPTGFTTLVIGQLLEKLAGAV